MGEEILCTLCRGRFHVMPNTKQYIKRKYCINAVYFSPLQVENKPCEGVMNVHLFLGLLAWLRFSAPENL
jgi:hypothetical protein